LRVDAWHRRFEHQVRKLDRSRQCMWPPGENFSRQARLVREEHRFGESRR
jgi:hypothetical protein